MRVFILPIEGVYRKQPYLAVPFLIVFLLLRGALFSQENPLPLTQSKPALDASGSILTVEPEWTSFQSRNFTVYYAPTVDLKAVQRRLNRRMFYLAGKLVPDPLLSASDEKIAFRLDTLLSRAKEVLDMYPRMSGLKIKIFKNREELSEEYYSIFKIQGRFKSFYVHKYKTIYVSEADISDSVVAHEMGHAIIDHYFSVIPPAKIAEMIASYVDLHLEG